MKARRALLAPLLAASLALAPAPLRAAGPDPDPWVAPDKALHFGVSAGVSGTSYGVTSLVTSDIRIRVAFGVGTGLVVGAVKELLDMAGLGRPSWKDFAWDVAGTIVGVGIAVAIDFAVRGAKPIAATAH